VIRGYRQAVVQAQRELGMSASLIMCILRDMDAGYAMATLMEALPYKDFIIGLGLDSDERGHPPNKFAAVFARARKEGFLLTAHCDVDQPNSVEHIRQALEDVQVDRIDHGTNVVEDGALVALLKRRRVGLTCCPVSNAVVTADFKGREIVALLRDGVRVTVNSDDPAYFRAYVNENMEKMAAGTDVTRAELVQLQRNALEISWLSSEKRDVLMNALNDYAAKHAHG
jgi:adenosine deaminase